MKVTRDVVVDLWTVYESGEASADTRALVEQYLQEDPELARQLRENGGAKALRPTPFAQPRDSEMDALLRTQKLVEYRRQALLLGIALVGLGSMLRYGRMVVMGLASLCLLAWLVLGLCGRRLFGLSRR
jgi:hypothetical protein